MTLQNEKILCVDDEPNVLSGYSRQLRKEFALEPRLAARQPWRP